MKACDDLHRGAVLKKKRKNFLMIQLSLICRRYRHQVFFLGVPEGPIWNLVLRSGLLRLLGEVEARGWFTGVTGGEW